MNKYPDLRNAKMLSIDIETKDPKLKEYGNGVYRKDGHICGVAVDNCEGFSEYYNLGHYDCTSEERSRNLAYLKAILASPIPKIGANLMYDLDWLINHEGLIVRGPYYDTLTAEALLDEYTRGKNNLDSLATKYLNEKKKNNQLLEYCEKMGWKTTKRAGGREHIYKMPYEEVRSYALADVDQPQRIWKIQRDLLEEQGLSELYDIEQRLFPLLLLMRRNGVRIDETGLYRLGMTVSDEIYRRKAEIKKLAGFDMNPNSAKQIQEVFDKNGWEYTRNDPTPKMIERGITEGNPCFNKAALKKSKVPFAKKILDLRHLCTMMSLFIEPWPKMLVKGVLHCNFIPLGFDEGGTVSGRFSSSKPNLQQVSSKEEDEGAIPGLEGLVLRKLFIPLEDCEWLKIDWSQIEYRIIAHYGIGGGSEKIRDRYNEDPTTDYHNEMMTITGITNRKDVKGLNFGAAYEMGWKTMANTFGWEMDYAKTVYTMYHKKVPFIKHTSKRVARVAEDRGYIKTILGRRARLLDKKKSYVMFNRLVQGSAADLMKLAMVLGYEEGLFGGLFPDSPSVEDHLIPHLTVHDELDCSKPKTDQGLKNALRLKEIMETCIELKVPIIADAEIGESWGKLKDL